MKSSFFFFFLSLFLLSHSLQASNKIDPLLKSFQNKSSASPLLRKTLQAGESSQEVSVLIRIRSSKDAQEVQKLIIQLKGSPHSAIGDILTATLPLTALESLEKSPKILSISSENKLNFQMNVARSTTGVDLVQNGYGTIGHLPYLGAGVLVGVVDSGIDCAHADFHTLPGKTRILYYWDQNGNGEGVREVAHSSGVEYSGEELANGDCLNSPDTIGHGTHVAGIAAGDDDLYTGVAPNTFLLIVKLKNNSETDPQESDDNNEDPNPTTTSLIDAVNYLMQKADSLYMPIVVNLSLGGHVGPHDGTSLQERALNNFLMDGESEIPGRSIVAAAGNENIQPNQSGGGVLGGIHAEVNVTDGSPKAFEMVMVNIPRVIDDGIAIDVWLNAGGTCTIAVDGYGPGAQKTAPTTPPLIDMMPVSFGNSSLMNSDGVLNIALDTQAQDPNNGKQRAVVAITRVDKTIPYSSLNYTFDLIFDGDCKGDAWLVSASGQPTISDFSTDLNGQTNDFGNYTYGLGDSNKTVVMPGTASKILTVASFMSRASWVNINGDTISQTAKTGSVPTGISTYSSLGPTADGRVKPDIAAPGEPIVSSFSAQETPSDSFLADSTHREMEGTSMASPYIAGFVALMFQKNSNLTASQIKNLIQENATVDSFTESARNSVGVSAKEGAAVDFATGVTLNNTWGAGKLNAPATMNATPASPKNGCSLTTDLTNDSSNLLLLFFMLAMSAVGLFRFRRI